MTALLIIGAVISLIGGVWLLIIAFKDNIWWGLGSLLVPLVSLIFVITHWEVSKRPFFVQLIGAAFIIAAMLMAPSTPQIAM
jgi:hypothetical protein